MHKKKVIAASITRVKESTHKSVSAKVDTERRKFCLIFLDVIIQIVSMITLVYASIIIMDLITQ